MATYYLPNENGWSEDHGYPYKLRLKIEQSYNAGTNKSTLTITPQFKGGQTGVQHLLTTGSILKAGNTTLFEVDSQIYGFYVSDGGWAVLKNVNTNTIKTVSHTVTHNADGSASVSFTMRGQVVSASTACSFFDTAAATLNLSESRQFKLTISQGTGSRITVTRSGSSLPNGATISYGDVLTVSFEATAGYTLSSHTVNGVSFTSGNTYTVTGAVTAAATAARAPSTIETISASAETQGYITLTMKRSGTLWHKARVKDGSTTIKTSAAFAQSAEISVPRSWFNDHPTATSFPVTVSVQSYTDSSCTTAVGSPATATVTIRADSGMKPVLGSGYAAAAPYNTGDAASINKFISGISRAEVSLDSTKLDMSAAAGATVSSISVTGGGSTATSSPYRTGVLRDRATVTVTVTDSRGRKGTQTLTVQTLAYSEPRITELEVIRCDSSGNEDENGSYYAVTANAVISGLDGANSLTLKANGYTLQNTVTRILGGSLNPDLAYTVTVKATDTVGSETQRKVKLPGRLWAMKFRPDGRGVGFGCAPAHAEALELPDGWSAYVGGYQHWCKKVTLGPGTSQTVELPVYRQLLVSPDYGPTWIVQTGQASATPIVSVLFNTAPATSPGVAAAANCSITLSNASSTSTYNFYIRTI